MRRNALLWCVLVAAAGAGLPACGSCSGGSRPVLDGDGGAKVLIDEFDGGKTRFRARNRTNPATFVVPEDAGSK